MDGNLKWSDGWNGGNCSGVHFVGFNVKMYAGAEYTQDPPDDNLYWQRIDPENAGFAGGVFYKFDLFFRTKSGKDQNSPDAAKF